MAAEDLETAHSADGQNVAENVATAQNAGGAFEEFIAAIAAKKVELNALATSAGDTIARTVEEVRLRAAEFAQIGATVESVRATTVAAIDEFRGSITAATTTTLAEFDQAKGTLASTRAAIDAAPVLGVEFADRAQRLYRDYMARASTGLCPHGRCWKLVA